jgi:prevent-host-death family protein
MTTSIAESRQQLSTLIDAAQLAPQIITKRAKPVAVLVSADYFARIGVDKTPVAPNFYMQLMALREAFPPQDNTGLPGMDERPIAWSRANPFAEAD